MHSGLARTRNGRNDAGEREHEMQLVDICTLLCPAGRMLTVLGRRHLDQLRYEFLRGIDRRRAKR